MKPMSWRTTLDSTTKLPETHSKSTSRIMAATRPKKSKLTTTSNPSPHSSHTPNEAAEVKHVVEYEAGRRSFPRGPGGRAGEAVPKTSGEHGGEEGQHQDGAQL